jgi:hypothetical protein
MGLVSILILATHLPTLKAICKENSILTYWNSDIEPNTTPTCDFEELNKLVSVKYPTESNFKLFPNPTDKILNISSNFDRAFNLELVDYSGKVVYKTSFAKETIIDVSALPAGIYIVKCVNDADNSSYGTKVIVQ